MVTSNQKLAKSASKIGALDLDQADEKISKIDKRLMEVLLYINSLHSDIRHNYAVVAAAIRLQLGAGRAGRQTCLSPYDHRAVEEVSKQEMAQSLGKLEVKPGVHQGDRLIGCTR